MATRSLKLFPLACSQAQRCLAVTEASALGANMHYSSVCPWRRRRGQGLVCQIFQFFSGAFCSVRGMVNDGEEVSCDSYLLPRNSRSMGCPMEMEINGIKPDTGEFYTHNKTLVGL